MDSKVKEQILAIRKTGLTNMFDTLAVQRIAHEMNFFNLFPLLFVHFLFLRLVWFSLSVVTY